MAFVYRHRYYTTDLVEIPVDSTTVIAIGDNVLLDSNLAVPASDLTDAGDAAANREAGADVFAGIALSASANGETADVRIGTAGVWAMEQASAAAIQVGDPVGLYATTAGIADQTVVEDATSFIGYCWKEKSSSGTEVLVKLFPSIWNTPQS